jgi:hypothetical protein
MFIVIFILVVNTSNSNISFAQTSTITDNFIVPSTLIISDGATEAVDPTSPISLTVTPAVGASDATASQILRIRSNQASWMIAVTKGAFSAGTTSILESDITVAHSKTAGSAGNVSAGTLQYASKTLNLVTSGETVISGSAKTSSTRDSNNLNNYLQIDTTYSIPQDFFFTPGTASISLTYTLTSP